MPKRCSKTVKIKLDLNPVSLQSHSPRSLATSQHPLQICSQKTASLVPPQQRSHLGNFLPHHHPMILCSSLSVVHSAIVFATSQIFSLPLLYPEAISEVFLYSRALTEDVIPITAFSKRK